MTVYCIEQFKLQFHKLSSHKKYPDFVENFSEAIFDQTFDQASHGRNLNSRGVVPYIKKRIKGRGGYRSHLLSMVKDQAIYLLYVYPKRGPLGSSNMDSKVQGELFKVAAKAIENDDLYIVKKEGENLTFTKK